jgi:hypothetical protein
MKDMVKLCESLVEVTEEQELQLGRCRKSLLNRVECSKGTTSLITNNDAAKAVTSDPEQQQLLLCQEDEPTGTN